MPYRQTVIGWSSDDGDSEGGITRIQSSSILGGGTAGQSGDGTASDGDYIQWFVNLAAGTYTLTHTYTSASNRGKWDWYLDTTKLGTIDGYSAGPVYNVVSTVTNITIAADGNYTLKLLVNGKHASSTEYYYDVPSVTLHRTGA